MWRWLELVAARNVNLDSAINVTDETYINGVPVRIDEDYYQGWLLEVVDRPASTVSFIAVTAFHGPRTVDGDMVSWDHDSMWYEPSCGTFFDRTEHADPVTVGRWAVSVIYGMMQGYAELRRR